MPSRPILERLGELLLLTAGAFATGAVFRVVLDAILESDPISVGIAFAIIVLLVELGSGIVELLRRRQ